MKKILVLSLYGNKAASTRHRFTQFVSDFKTNGYDLDIKPLLCDRYLENKFNNQKISFFYLIKRLLIRLYYVFFQYKYDLIIIHCELIPFLPSFIERFLLWKKFAYDFDDAFFLKYNKFNILIQFLFKNKFKQLVSKAKFVNAGSSYLFNYSYKLNKNTFLMPTSVDIKRYCNLKLKENNKKFTIGWLGSPSSEVYLNLVADALNKISSKDDIRILIVGGNNKNLFKNNNTEYVNWSLQDEIKIINKFDIGIMPLFDTDWEKGKCSFKLIQYMACEIPVISSPVGFNLQVVEDNISGFFAINKSEWIKKINLLKDSEILRNQMGKNGRKRVEKLYSKDKIFFQFLKNVSNIIIN